MPIISIPKSLREKLGEEGSEALAAVLNEHGKEAENAVIKTAAQRFEKKLSEEITSVRLEMAESEKRFEKKLSEEISGVREEMVRSDCALQKEIQKSKTDTVKWMFIFWIGQIGALLGILFMVFK